MVDVDEVVFEVHWADPLPLKSLGMMTLSRVLEDSLYDSPTKKIQI